MVKADIGLIGLAVMGQSLVLNMERNDYTVAVYNRSTSKVDEFIRKEGRDKNIIGCYNIEELCNALKQPRKIILMIKAGKPIDDIISNLFPFLNSGDIIIDGGNSFFKDSIRRSTELKGKGLFYLGIGISGGKEGALKGPSIMVGGAKEAWQKTEKIFKKIAAKVDDKPCCSYLGPNGVGHYVKMVHNGIEYSDMQLIAEAYFFLKNLLNLTTGELKEIFTNWNIGDLDSYLIQITKNIFAISDPETGKPIVDIILDAAVQKGTGIWTSQEALEIGIPVPSIAEAVFARSISAQKDQRLKASKLLSGPTPQFSGNRNRLIETTRKALYAAKICSYAQGFSLLRTASKKYKWELKFRDVTTIWRGGCIIRAHFLEQVENAFRQNQGLENLLLDSYFVDIIENSQKDWRYIVTLAVENGIPVPAFSSALAYYDSYRNPFLPANLIQAQRDYFGGHGFERVDKERGKIFHYENWPAVDD
jgi:6-phosphogluconate dehydrogenase